MDTSQLVKRLESLLSPTGEDLDILEGRQDTKFSQKVRNLRAHHTLSRQGLATESSQSGGSTLFTITDEGEEMVRRNYVELQALLDFPIADSSTGLHQLAAGAPLVVIDEAVVTEGKLVRRTHEYRSRSQQLRNAAVDEYTVGGRIHCDACGFEFASAYPGLGNDFIEIHHLRPVTFMRGEELSITEALKNVRPLCANCHRMVHRSRPPLTIADLRKIIGVSYAYV